MNAIEVAKMFFGIPYKWGGNSPVSGLDCSGLVCEVLRSLGLIIDDMNAQGLYDHFSKDLRPQLAGGSLLFFGKSRSTITHVALAIDNKLMFEAGGGDHTTVNVEEANRKNAYVRIRPIEHRRDLVAVLK